MTRRRDRSGLPNAWRAMRWALVAAACAGCGESLELIPVHGRVVYRGEPLRFGGVMLQPEGAGPLARGEIDADGSFVLGTQTATDGVRPGRCRVRVTAYQAQQSDRQATGQGELALGPSAIPEKYTGFGSSGLVVDVAEDMELPLVIELE